MFVYTLNDIITLGTLAIFLFIGLVVLLYDVIKRSLCSHKKYYRKYDGRAICCNCDKDLGDYWKLTQADEGEEGK